MAEYIELETAIKEMSHMMRECFPEAVEELDAVITTLKEVPAADVVAVVRCRECIFWDTSWNPGVGVIGEAQYCPRCQLVTLKDSFCSGAYRKDGGQDNE